MTESAEGESIIRIEEGATVCSSADSPPTAFNIDHTTPGGGDDHPGGDDPGRGESNGDEESLEEERLRREELIKVAKISILITAQTAASLILFPMENASRSRKSVLYLAVGMGMCAYVFCYTAIMVRRKKPLVSSIMSVLGTSCSGLGFLLAMCLIIPEDFLWVAAVAFTVLISSVAVLLISSRR